MADPGEHPPAGEPSASSPAEVLFSRSAALWAVRWLPVVGLWGAMHLAGPPIGVTPQGWWFASVFSATIIGFLTRPLPMGPMVLSGLVVLLLAGAFGSGAAAVEGMLAGFADATVWLVVAAFLISGTVVRTGFGRRVALLLISRLGRTTLGLGYSIASAELLLGPIIPSNTARGGGVMSPIVNALAQALKCNPYNDRSRTGGYLVLCGSHANLITSAMFFTGMAANPQLRNFAAADLNVTWTWTTWLQGSWLPGLASMALLPALLYWLQRPELTHSPAAKEEAAHELAEMGPWNARQIMLGALLLAMVAAWASEPLHGVHAAGVALLGVALILALGLDRWVDFTADRGAWDALMWLGGLVAMAEQLERHGVMTWFAHEMQYYVAGFSGVAAAVVVALIYFFSMYGFSMLTGHIMAMASVFFVVARAASAPPLLTVALISYFSNLCGCLTNYSTGQVVIYSGFGYVSTQRWFAIGLAVAAFHLALWLGIGMPYWRVLGWW
ncbi:MAG: DASS family sodium-coupled anion symporter [Pirellulales bacterium]|nr:DASS family sodium-coupled anion symporter [Pirellulales bacterium]